MKLIIIGWDGATWDLLRPWAATGRLPAVHSLLQHGAWGPLRSTIQPLTAVAWSSFLTGCRPGKHGLYDFISRVPGRYELRLAGRDQRTAPDLWHYLSAAGKRLAAVNVPMMVPVAPVNGILVGGIDAPGLSPQTVSPADFITELHRAVPGYRIAAAERTLSAWVESLREMIVGREQLLTHLLRREPWDCLMVVFSATDIAQHIFWGHMARREAPYADLILDIYQRCDAILGRLLDQLDGDTTLLLISDHGAGPLSGAIHLNRYLEVGGFLRRAPRRPHPAAPLLRLGKRYLPAATRAWLRRRFPAARNQLESSLLAAAYDWSATELYSFGSYGNLFINLRGREPAGIVDPAAVDDLVARVAAHLDALRDPDTRKKLVKGLWRREELYSGPAVHQAPDLIIEWADLSYEVRTRFGADGDTVFAPTMPLNDLAPETVLTATHRMEGIIAANGPTVQPGRVEHAEIIDLAPTILHLLAQSVPRHMDGRVLPELTAGTPPIRFDETELAAPDSLAGLSTADAAQIEERLRSLGYLG